MVGDTTDTCPPSAQHLNTDVLVEIFLQSSLGGSGRENEYESLFPKPSIRDSPLILGRVCHSWRQVALSTPQLWSYLYIPDTWNSPVGMSEWLKRSGTSPLTFSLFDKRHENPLYRIDALNVLLANAHRWKHVELDADIKLILLFLHSVECSAPLLETLQIRDYHNWTDGEDLPDWFSLDLPKYPRLVSLRLPASVKMVLHHRNIILHSLRNVWLGFLRAYGPGIISMDGYLTLLSLCPNVEDASFAITDSSPLQRTDGIIEHNIRKLCVFVPDELDVGSFFDYLRLPHLVDLQIQDMTHETPRKFPWSHITSLLHRSQASLIRVHFSWDIPPDVQSDDDLLGILHLSPDIQTIFLHRLPVSDVLLRALAQPAYHGETASCLCPKLVDISVVLGGNFSDAALKDMILFRHGFRGAKPFERIRLVDCGLTRWILVADEEIQKCIAGGLSLKFGTLE
ncbi:hypothetical protein BD410DRAFT_785081 [Rickenella mellea]|uniref:Uncharacterized protein n=1 Tax=Rickenella mellea TaxID=50990 RepID=A0A4Y7QEB3_9AGAM|nr:hypothetical protein BD410DRAFT_785081 [Rickenella mellea]